MYSHDSFISKISPSQSRKCYPCTAVILHGCRPKPYGLTHTRHQPAQIISYWTYSNFAVCGLRYPKLSPICIDNDPDVLVLQTELVFQNFWANYPQIYDMATTEDTLTLPVIL